MKVNWSFNSNGSCKYERLKIINSSKCCWVPFIWLNLTLTVCCYHNETIFLLLHLPSIVKSKSFLLVKLLRMKQMFVCLILMISCVFNVFHVNGARWTAEQANNWYRNESVYFWSNFIPSTSVNVIDMWQTFDSSTIEHELRWASEINMNIMRVFLHVLFYEQNAPAYYKQIDNFLTIADRFNIKIMFVLFDECWLPELKLGSQLTMGPMSWTSLAFGHK